MLPQSPIVFRDSLIPPEIREQVRLTLPKVNAQVVPSSVNEDPSVEVDVLIEELGLAFEYQGAHHFFDTAPTPTLGATQLTQFTDQHKAIALAAVGLTFIEVPHWWQELDPASDKTAFADRLATLRDTILALRPDLQSKLAPLDAIS